MIEMLAAFLAMNAIALCSIVYFVWLSKKGISALLYPSVIEEMRKNEASKGEIIIELTIATLFFLPALLVWYMVILVPSIALLWVFLHFLVRDKNKI